MVRILANGDIVQDDDPRVRANAQHRENISRQEFFNVVPNAGHAPPQQRAARPGGRSPFSELNQQLVNMGFPLWNLGNHVVEPVMSILLLFLLMMVGVRGLLLVGLIYVVSHLSQR
ncbi:protein FAM241B [Pelodiscus sinensis]|uniref:protein FAM241B n=1 Tax=Pelodiscus sinensis TaxID=13735 RepID=UPI003F6C6687